jgi:stress response protein YsnF
MFQRECSFIVPLYEQPYVKEEVAVKKKPVTETRTVSEQETTEKVKVKGTGGEEEVEE